MKRNILAVFVCFVTSALVCTAQAADPNAEAELHLRGLDALWSKAAAAKDLDKTVSFYADDAVVMAPNTPIATTKEGVRKIWKDFFDMPGSSVSWRTSKVDIAQSGDLAYVTGTYEESAKDAAGKSSTDHGKYLCVFKKQADGKWKSVADIWNSDSPAAGAGSAEKK